MSSASASASTDPSPFTKTLAAFCNELRLTFPELVAHIDRAASQTPSTFWRSWQSHVEILATRNFETLTSDRRGLIIGPVCMTPALWGELSASTQAAIWRYLRTLILEAALETGIERIDLAKSQLLLTILSEERLETGGEAEAEVNEMFSSTMEHLTPLMMRLKGTIFAETFDMSGIDMPEIPEHLRNGCIARLVQDMAKHFNPEEFGIDPALLAGDDVEAILRKLADIYQRDPSMLINGAKRMAEKIKRQVVGGSLDRDQLIAEAKEYVALFKEHPLFKEAVGKIQGLIGEDGIGALFGAASGGGSSGAPSERLRAVQERLRRKMAARNAGGKTSAQGK